MNAKRLRSTTISTLLLVLILLPATAFAQGAGAAFRGDPFLRGRNLCGVGTLPVGYVPEGNYRASSASLYGGTEQGDFRPGFSSSSIWRAGAEARTDGFYDRGRTFLTGSFSFEEMHGKDMMTSMFINPGYYPIDVLEFTPGDKKLQTYRFSGGIGRALTDRWRIGGRVDFASQNYSKRKDIRHTNYALDLTVSPSVLYTGEEGLRLGLSGVFRKSSESIEAEQVGAATAETYMAFFDKGLRYGTMQAWDGSGIHLAEAGVNRLPVREFSFGAAIQLACQALYLDAEYLRTSGFVGEKGYDWYRFPGHRVASNALWNHRRFRFSFHIGWMGQDLEESVIDKVNSGGVTLPTVYGWNLVSRRRQLDLVPTLVLPLSHPAFRSLTLGYVGVIKDEQASPYYPYTDRWHAALHRVHGAANLGLPFGGAWNRFGLTLGAKALWGSDRSEGLQPTDPAASFHGLSVESPIPASEPTRLTSDWVRKREYMLSSALELSAGLRYNLAVLPGLSVSADAAWLHAYRIEYLLGKNRLTANLRIGYDF